MAIDDIACESMVRAGIMPPPTSKSKCGLPGAIIGREVSPATLIVASEPGLGAHYPLHSAMRASHIGRQPAFEPLAKACNGNRSLVLKDQ